MLPRIKQFFAPSTGNVTEHQFSQKDLLKQNDDGTFSDGACSSLAMAYGLANPTDRDRFEQKDYKHAHQAAKKVLYNIVNPSSRDGETLFARAYFDKQGKPSQFGMVSGKDVVSNLANKDATKVQAFYDYPLKHKGKVIETHQLYFEKDHKQCILFDANTSIMKGSCSRVLAKMQDKIADVESGAFVSSSIPSPRG